MEPVSIKPVPGCRISMGVYVISMDRYEICLNVSLISMNRYEIHAKKYQKHIPVSLKQIP